MGMIMLITVSEDDEADSVDRCKSEVLRCRLVDVRKRECLPRLEFFKTAGKG